MRIHKFLIDALLTDSMTGKFTLTKSFSLIFVILTVIIEIFAMQKCDLLLEIIIVNLAFVSVSLGFRTILLKNGITAVQHNENNTQQEGEAKQQS